MSVKRAKPEDSDAFLRPHTPRPLPLSAAQGVERIPLPPSANVNRLSSEYLRLVTRERTEILRRQGRRVVGLPMVLDDGIVLNWVCDMSGSVDGVRSHKVDDIPSVVLQSVAWHAEHWNEPAVPIGGGSAADPIVIDSDEDRSENPPVSRTGTQTKVSLNLSPSLSQDVGNHSDSDIEFLSPIQPENIVDDDPNNASNSPPARSPRPSPDDVSRITSSDPRPSRSLTREEVAVALHREQAVPSSDGAEVTTSDDGSDKDMDDVDQLSARRAKPPSLPSLEPIRKLLARTKRRGERDLPRVGTTVGPKVPEKQGRKDTADDHAATSSESDEELECQASDPQLKRVPLPKTDHGRSRRLLVPESTDLPLVAVTMRGDCHFIARRKKFRITGYSLPNPGVFRHVGDACMVGDTAVLGCDKGTHQISLLSVAGRPQLIDVARCPHSSGPRYQDTQKRGVSCLAAMHAEGGHIKFISGGHDGTIHKWTASVGELSEPRSEVVVSHGACISALAYGARDSSIVASAQRRLHITDLNRCTTVTHLFSNAIQQIHIHPQAAYVTMLEVRHLDRQVELYDIRKGRFDGEPCLSFGHRSADGKFPGGHTRGSVHLVQFGRGSEDGCVLLWDFRNSKTAVVARRYQQAEKVVHTVFADGDMATFGEGVVTFFGE